MGILYRIKTAVDIWYRASEDEINLPGGGQQPEWSLDEIAQNGRAIYTSENGATYEDTAGMFESNTIGNETSYLVWENDGDGSNYRWFGLINIWQLHVGRRHDCNIWSMCI